MTLHANSTLVQIADDGEPRASTEAIALGYQAKHRSVLQLLRRYMAQIESFGPCAFEVRKGQPLAQGGYAKATEFALLNERQAMFLLTLMRNNVHVVEFKVQLVHEFVRMAEALRNRDLTMWERRLKFEAKDQVSVTKGRVGSRLMNERKSEKPLLHSERQILESAMQPALLN